MLENRNKIHCNFDSCQWFFSGCLSHLKRGLHPPLGATFVYDGKWTSKHKVLFYLIVQYMWNFVNVIFFLLLFFKHFIPEWFSYLNIPLGCFRDSILVGGREGRPEHYVKFMKTSVSGMHEVIGSIIKEEHVMPPRVAFCRLFLFVWTIMQVFDVTTSLSTPVFSPDI